MLAEDDPDYGVLELTERGVELVKLVIRDEDELNESIAGNTGEFFSDLQADPQVRDIVLVMEQGSSITGWVNNSFGEPIVNASVGIERLEMQLGSNRIFVYNLLSHDWKGVPFAVTDDQGNYSLKNLPACWDRIQLKAVAAGHVANEGQFESDGHSITDACTFQLRQGTEDAEFFRPAPEGSTEPAGGIYKGVGRTKE
ncbi:MAG: carboxypeptidase-like regulatory domain-containing protein [Planctomycetota bacterium]